MEYQFHRSKLLTATDNILNFLKTERRKKKIYAIAETKFIEELQNSEFEFPENIEEIELIIVTLDGDFTNEKFEIAKKALQNGAEFFAANVDYTCPIIEGEIKDA